MCAYAATFAVIIVDSRRVVGAELNACIWAVNPADSALGAFLQVDNRLERSPRSSFASASNTWA
jgi:hypothetical protein